MYHSLSVPRQTAWEWETFYKTPCGQGGKIEGSHTVNCFQVCDYTAYIPILATTIPGVYHSLPQHIRHFST